MRSKKIFYSFLIIVVFILSSCASQKKMPVALDPGGYVNAGCLEMTEEQIVNKYQLKDRSDRMTYRLKEGATVEVSDNEVIEIIYYIEITDPYTWNEVVEMIEQILRGYQDYTGRTTCHVYSSTFEEEDEYYPIEKILNGDFFTELRKALGEHSKVNAFEIILESNPRILITIAANTRDGELQGGGLITIIHYSKKGLELEAGQDQNK